MGFNNLLLTESRVEENSTLKKPEFPSVTFDQVKINNAVCEHDVGFVIMLGEQECSLQVYPHIDKKDNQCFYFKSEVTLNGKGSYLFFNKDFFGFLYSGFDFEIEFDRLDPDIQFASLKAAVENINSQLKEQINNLDVRLESICSGVGSHSDVFDESITFFLEIKYKNNCFKVLVESPVSNCDSLLALFGGMDRKQNVQSYRNYTIEASIRLGWQQLTLADFEAIEYNDIILIETYQKRSNSLFLSNKLRYLVNFKDGQCVVVKRMNENEDSNGPDQAFETDKPHEFEQADEKVALTQAEFGSEIDEQGASVLNELPVQLIFELARKKMSIREVEALESGYVFDLAINPSQAVTLYANGLKIAQCEIIEIGGRLGARIVQVIK